MKPIVFVVLALLGLSAFGPRAGDDSQSSGGWSITEVASAAETPRPLPAFVDKITRSKDCRCDICRCDECRCKPGLVCDKNGCRVVDESPVAPTPDPISNAVAFADCGGRQVVRQREVVTPHSETTVYRYRSASNRCGPVRRFFGGWRARRACR